MGEFRVDVSSINQRFLEAFRLRSEHASSFDDAMRAAIAARLIEEHGNPTDAATALWALARRNEWFREGERAERYLLAGALLNGLGEKVRNKAVTDATIDYLLHTMAQALDRIALPTLGGDAPNGHQMADRMLAIVRTRVSTFA